MQFPSRDTNINIMESQKGDLVLYFKSGHIFPRLSHTALDTRTPMSHLRADYSSNEWSSFLWWDFFPPKKLFSWLSRAVWHTAQAHKCSSRHWGRNGNTSQSVRERRICHSAASSLSDHIKLIMKLHFEQLQNLPAGQTRGALPRKGENTQKEQISLGVLWKSSREHNEEMFWERELGLVQQCRSCYWQGGFRLFGFGVFFGFFFSFLLQKKHMYLSVPMPLLLHLPRLQKRTEGNCAIRG